MKIFLLLFVLVANFSNVAQAMSSRAVPPVDLGRENYRAWLEEIGATPNPFHENLFDWYSEEWNRPLPEEALRDPEGLYVSVERPLRETIELEDMGEIEAGITYGLETYAVIDAPIDLALEALLFKWGKPIGAREGTTYPMDTVYGFRSESISERWGFRNYQTITMKDQGGVAKAQRDIYTLLVRGNAQEGYVLFGSFFKPNGNTSTSASFSIMFFKPLPDGRTAYKVSSRHLGQSYTFLGIEYGRRNFGFNRDRIRVGQKEFLASIEELKRTGTIRERKP